MWYPEYTNPPAKCKHWKGKQKIWGKLFKKLIHINPHHQCVSQGWRESWMKKWGKKWLTNDWKRGNERWGLRREIVAQYRNGFDAGYYAAQWLALIFHFIVGFPWSYSRICSSLHMISAVYWGDLVTLLNKQGSQFSSRNYFWLLREGIICEYILLSWHIIYVTHKIPWT